MNAFQRWGNKIIFGQIQLLWKLAKKQTFYKYSFCHVLAFTNYCNGLSIVDRKTNIFIKVVLNKGSLRLLSISRNRCWQCSSVVTERDLVCMSCGTVQQPNQKLNYFELFKEPPHFDLDSRNLTVKFRRLQTLLHPDKFATRTEKEKEYSAEQSSLVNKAYQTLLRPIDRGLYLLELHSKPLEEGEVQMPSDFLMDVMEVNETLDKCSSPGTLESIRHVNDAKIQILYSEVSLAFKEKNIGKAGESLRKLKYYLNIDEKIKRLEEELGITRD